MLRREFIAGAATSALLVCPLRAHAQQSATRRMRIGILIYSTPQRDPNTQTLLEGFRQLGYVDGQNGMLGGSRSGFQNSPRIWFRASRM